jgi:hypothetical protein
MPASKPAPRRGRREPAPSVARAVADELGITTPKSAERRSRKGPMTAKRVRQG